MTESQIKEEYFRTIQESGILCGIPETNQKKVVQELQIHVREYEEEELIFLEGEEIKQIAILHSGTVRGEKFHMEGAVDLMHIYRHGEIFGAEAPVSRLKTSPLTYVANEAAEVLFIDFPCMMRTEYAADFGLTLLQILADDNIKKLYKIEVLSKRGLRDRIMTYLKIISGKVGRPEFSIHMDREKFAQYLCVNRSALSYELNQMKREGVIDFKKDHFRILKF